MTAIDDDPKRGSDVPMKTDVLVVGAGPTGLCLACGLARRGIAHVVIDHTPQVAAYSQSTMLDARTLEELETIDASEPLVRRGVKTTHFSLRDRDEELFGVDFAALRCEYPYALMLPESVAEALLSERLAAYGSTVHRPVTAIGLEQSPSNVTVQLWDGSASRSGSPSRRSIVARYVVGCDGKHSQIRGALEIPFVGSSIVETFVMADVRMAWTLPRSEVDLFFSEDGLLLVAPLPDDRYRILATVEKASAVPDRDELQMLLATRGLGASPARINDVVWSTRFAVDLRLAMHYRSGRVFLAGDAAHSHSPAGGQGMNSGIQDALYLADQLADVLAGGSDDAVLDRYESEQRPVAESVHRLTRRMSAAATLRGQRSRLTRNRFLRIMNRVPGFSSWLARRLSGLEWSKQQRIASDENKLLYGVTLGLVALLVGSSLTRALQFHALFAYFVGLVQGAALVASGWLAAKRKREARGFGVSAAAAACLFAAFGIWIVFLRKVNADVTTIQASAIAHDDQPWVHLSPLSHWSRVALHACSFALLAMGPSNRS